MSLTTASAGRRTAEAERRERILEAAEHAFVRHGFHATTMQHVADEVGTSAGNLYRYFPSKEAIVEGLCELDQARRAESFAAFGDLMARNGDLTEAMRKGLREHVFSKPPEKARLIVEIWAEAGRNPRVAEITRAIDADVLIGLERLMDVAKAAGAASPALDSRFGARFFFTFVAGLFKRIAIEADFDAEAETPMALGVLKALFAGKLAPEPAAPDGGADSCDGP
jgi:TetR/AcrR family transcriptional regulator, repressor for uid operon